MTPSGRIAREYNALTPDRVNMNTEIALIATTPSKHAGFSC